MLCCLTSSNGARVKGKTVKTSPRVTVRDRGAARAARGAAITLISSHFAPGALHFAPVLLTDSGFPILSRLPNSSLLLLDLLLRLGGLVVVGEGHTAP